MTWKLRRDEVVAAYRCAAASLSSYCAPSAANPSSCDRTRSSDAASIACEQRYRRHLEKNATQNSENATQMAGISWRLTAILADAALAASCACALTPNTIIIA